MGPYKVQSGKTYSSVPQGQIFIRKYSGECVNQDIFKICLDSMKLYNSLYLWKLQYSGTFHEKSGSLRHTILQEKLHIWINRRYNFPDFTIIWLNVSQQKRVKYSKTQTVTKLQQFLIKIYRKFQKKISIVDGNDGSSRQECRTVIRNTLRIFSIKIINNAL